MRTKVLGRAPLTGAQGTCRICHDMSASSPLRLPQLDGLRGLAAAGVAFGFHAQFMFAPNNRPGEWGVPVLGWLNTSGWTLVDLFFLLSGYVFSHVYLPDRSLEHLRNLANYALARVGRLYPLHFFLLIYTAFLFSRNQENTAEAFFYHLFLMQVFAEPSGHTFVGPSWSISIEILCYVIFAAAVFARGKMLDMVSLVLVIGSALWLYQDTTAAWEISERMARGALGFFAGVMLWRHRHLLFRVPTVVLATAFLISLLLKVDGVHPVLPLTLVAWPAALLLALRSRLLAAPPLQWLGDRSYAIYLIHMPLIDLVAGWGSGGLSGGPWHYAGAILCLVGTTLLLSDLAFRRLELPARNAMRRHFLPARAGPERSGKIATE